MLIALIRYPLKLLDTPASIILIEGTLSSLIARAYKFQTGLPTLSIKTINFYTNIVVCLLK